MYILDLENNSVHWKGHYWPSSPYHVLAYAYYFDPGEWLAWDSECTDQWKETGKAPEKIREKQRGREDIWLSWGGAIARSMYIIYKYKIDPHPRTDESNAPTSTYALYRSWFPLDFRFFLFFLVWFIGRLFRSRTFSCGWVVAFSHDARFIFAVIVHRDNNDENVDTTSIYERSGIWYSNNITNI